MVDNSTIGLSTTQALTRLHDDIKIVIEEQLIGKKNWRNWKRSWVYDALHHCSKNTTICWTSAIILVLSAIGLSVIFTLNPREQNSYLPFHAFLIFLFVILNLCVVGWDNYLKHGEVLYRAQQLVEKLLKCRTAVRWTSANYPHLCSPASPCITLQWTYRDGEVVNLPWALLVKGDVIIIRPGQVTPGLCIPIDDQSGPILHANEVYSPPISSNNEPFNMPSARAPIENKRYLLQETPYLKNLRLALDQCLTRPVSYHNKERHLLMVQCFEQTVVPVILVIAMVLNAARYIYLSVWLGAVHWTDLFIVQPVLIVLPLLPLCFPLVWFLLNSLGLTRIRAILDNVSLTQSLSDPFEDADVTQPPQSTVEYHSQELRQYLLDVLLGRGPLLTRSVNLLHVLGSVTALCCVDKKGILSWPNPTAEKVFFLRGATDKDQSLESVNSEGYNSTPQRRGSGGAGGEETPAKPLFHSDGSVQTVTEVLDLTHDLLSPFKLQFDDPTWKKHLNSLKPLGLAILLNTCHMDTQEHYTQFCSHVTCEALHNEDLVPVTNRRCLCELAKQIGFQDQAQDIFTLEEQLCTFKHVQTDAMRRDIKFARQLSISTKLKFPFPHMMASVVRDRQTGSLQLMSQGTADVILDSCVEFWDGEDLYPLTQNDRKKILDFYQRSSLTAYCTAFAYRPLSKPINSKLSHVYLEIPADSKHLYLPFRSPTPLALSVVDAKWKGVLAQFHSTDSLLNMELKDDEISDMEGCFESQCNQVFIGMVTMQYQAQADIVKLIEQLERACIRFVHFSKENELRSRVFSEKMGLESGWNCHISLLSERNRSEDSQSESWINVVPPPQSPHLPSPPSLLKGSQGRGQYSSIDQEVHELNTRTNLASSRAMSFSAPGAINLECSTVKFDEDAANIDWNDDTIHAKSATSNRDRRTSQDSVLVQSVDLTSQAEPWRSLSCLTDSTDQSVPVNFDIWNRAKLPRGIDKIRPHLEMIDNVPLLVSLFTDCTSSVTRDMLAIMQDYGEVVCVIGSAANSDNMAVFMQADASIAIEPLYPQVCQKVPVFSAPTPSSGPSPIELSRALNAVSCAVALRREDPFSMLHIIMEARHFTQCLMNCLQFWLCCTASLCFLQFLGLLCMLPPIFTAGQVMFICCIIVPVLAVSLVALPTNPQVMQKATGKNECTVNSEIAWFVIWCYGLKSVPSVITILILYSATMASFCGEIARAANSTCFSVYPDENATVFLIETAVWRHNSPEAILHSKGWSLFEYSLLSVQHLSAFMFVVHAVVASISYIHRDASIWRHSPLDNRLWLLTSSLCLLLQLLYAALDLFLSSLDLVQTLDGLTPPWYVVLLAVLSPLLVFGVNEAVKWHEIKINKRFQRRKRLHFGTKLGMNSPF